MIDYRSDTVTRPGKAMLKAMFNAKTGDDVFKEDPTVNYLEAKAADMFGMEAGLFCPSGTMTNQIAIKCHTRPGDEVICETLSHIYQYEGGGIAFNSGCSVRLVQGFRGLLKAADIKLAVNDSNDIYRPLSKLVSLENTANRGGGSCYELEEILAIKKVATAHELAYHLDGARLFNALVAKNHEATAYGSAFDSISICLSKGLGAPVGSLLLGNKDFIKLARRIRKVFGGGMRQAGIIAAAGVYALDNHISRLAEDHNHALLLAEALQQSDFVKSILPVETNIIIFELSEKYTAPSFVHNLKDYGILAYAISAAQVRIVTHLDITGKMIKETINVFGQL